MAFFERLQNAASVEERQQIMSEQMAWQRQRAFEDLKVQLGLSDQEWSVVKPRLQKVYDLVPHFASFATIRGRLPRSASLARNDIQCLVMSLRGAQR